MVARVGLLVHGLDTRRVVDMRHRRDVGARHVELVDAEQLLLFRGHFAPATLRHVGDHQHVGAVVVDTRTSPRRPRAAPRARRGGTTSRYLTRRLSVFCISGERGSPRIERAPSARGPNSMRPWNQPTALPPASASARVADQRRPRQRGEFRTGGGETLFDVGLRVCRAEIGARHAVELAVEHARAALEPVIGAERRADRAAGVAGRRLHPDALELAVAQHLAVGHAVERDAAGEAQVLRAGLGRERAREPQHDLLGHRLDRGGEVHVALGEQAFRVARRAAEQRVELARWSCAARCSSRNSPG